MNARSPLSAAVVLVAVVAALGVSLAAGTRRTPPAPPVIAIVNLEAVVEGINARTSKQAVLDERRDSLQQKINDLSEELRNEQSTYDVLPESDKPEAFDRLRKLAFQREFEQQYAKQALDEMQASMLVELFDLVKTSIAELAEQNGYTMVLSSDEAVNVPVGTVAEVTRTISMRRLMYVADAHDITQEVITYMNNRMP